MSSSETASLNFWSSVYSVMVWLVALGVVMEGCEIASRRFAQRKQKRFIGPLQQPISEPQTPHWAHNVGDIGFLILVSALILEPICHSYIEAITGRENRRLTAQLDSTTRDASQANERVSMNELAAKKLEIELTKTKTELANAQARLNESVIDLQNANLPMDIGEQYSFANDLKSLAGIHVELRCVTDTKAQATLESLKPVFWQAGWLVINRGFIGDIGEQGVVIGYNGDDASVNAAKLLLKELTKRGVPSKFAIRSRVDPTNTIIVAVCQRPDKLHTDLMLVLAKQLLLSDELSKVNARISEIMEKSKAGQYNQITIVAAQAEYNDLSSKASKILIGQDSLTEQESKLYGEIDKAENGTNSVSPGIHINGATFVGNVNLFPPGFNKTNGPNVFMHNAHINPEILQ